jgi:hypothetical protein
VEQQKGIGQELDIIEKLDAPARSVFLVQERQERVMIAAQLFLGNHTVDQ